MFNALIAIATVAVVATASPPVTPHKPRTAWSLALIGGDTKDAVLLVESAQAINETAGREVFIIGRAATGSASCLPVFMRDVIPGSIDKEHYLAGLFESSGDEARISIKIGLPLWEERETMTHELLHALGIDHNADSRSIMYWEMGCPMCSSLTPEDVANIKKAAKDLSLEFPACRGE